jgi:hypothetical protein
VNRSLQQRLHHHQLLTLLGGPPPDDGFDALHHPLHPQFLLVHGVTHCQSLLCQLAAQQVQVGGQKLEGNFLQSKGESASTTPHLAFIIICIIIMAAAAAAAVAASPPPPSS